MVLTRRRLDRQTARQVGDLHEQIRVATSGLPLTASALRIRVTLAPGGTTAACELWGLIRKKELHGDRFIPARLAELSMGSRVRPQIIERALYNAGFDYPRTDVRGSARWRRLQAMGEVSPWFELGLHVPSDGQDTERGQEDA